MPNLSKPSPWLIIAVSCGCFCSANSLEGTDDCFYPQGQPQLQSNVYKVQEISTFEEPISVPEIKGLRLVGNLSDVIVDGQIDVKGATFCGFIIPGNYNDLLNQLFCKYVGQPLTRQILLDIKSEILCYYRQNAHPLVTVDIPYQNVTNGVIQIVVLEATLGKIICKGNRWFSTPTIGDYIQADQGETIDQDELLTDLTWINRNPFRHTELMLTPGQEEGTTDIELLTTDRIPIRPYIGVDNTGNYFTGRTRLFAGFTFSDLFGFDNLVSYQFTTATHTRRFTSHTASYTAQFPWRHLFMIYGGYAQIHPKMAKLFHSNGRSYQISPRYEIPIGCPLDNSLKILRFGYDYKSTNSLVLFNGADVSGSALNGGDCIVQEQLTTTTEHTHLNLPSHNVHLGQFMVQCNYGYDNGPTVFSASFEVYGSSGESTGSSSRKQFEKLRCNASNRYIYCRLTTGYAYTLCNGIELGGLLRGQVSSQALLPSEQFSLGGYDTVRGYDENAFLADEAVLINLELRSKPLVILNKFINCFPDDELLFLLFLDCGLGHNIHRLKGENNVDYLIGIGPGMRYRINSYLSARVDVGCQLHKLKFVKNYGVHVHAGIVASY